LNQLCEIRFHGRGGQGAWTASLLLAQAGLAEGKQIQSFPAFGPERAGAPLTAYTRISDEPILIHSNVYEPDLVVVLDSTLISPSIIEGVKKTSKIIVNSNESPAKIKQRLNISDNEVWVIDATSLSLRVIGAPITNTAMLGALIRASSIITLDSIIQVVKERFSGKVLEQNIEVIETAYKQVVMG
jgi:pyruvate ferredoxin oxidoreductase gamma subunit